VRRVLFTPWLVVMLMAACGLSLPTSTSPTPSTPPRLLTFETQHHFLDFTYAEGHLIFGGGPADDTRSSPDLIDRDIAAGIERVLGERSGSRGKHPRAGGRR